MSPFDVVIVGGAITGSVLALALSSQSQHQMRIAIIEKQPPNYAEQGGFDARAIALAAGSLAKFRQIQPLAGDDLATLLASISTPIKQIFVSDQGHFGKTRLCASEVNQPQLGAVVELAILGKALNAQIAQQPNIQLFCPDQVASLERKLDSVELTLASGQQLHCALIVAADGIHSQIAASCGVESEILQDYQQSAIIANIDFTNDHHNQAFERFTAKGPLALLPLAPKRMSLVWCVPPNDPLMTATDSEFLYALQQTFGWQLGKCLRVSKRFVYPLVLQRAKRHIGHRLAIVGNAAQQLHPVAGQGFNLGLRDLTALAALLGEAFERGEDLGNYALLARFEQSRIADQQRLMQATNGLISLFCCDLFPQQLIRHLGLAGLSLCSPARHWFTHQAMGWQ